MSSDTVRMTGGTDVNGNQQCITNLACLEVSDITATTINATNINVATLNITSNLTFNNLSLRPTVDLLNVYDLATNLVTPGATNRYQLDFGHTNAIGATNIYATLRATNDVRFDMPTNGIRGSLLSFNVVAAGANRVIYMPTNLPHLDTNEAGFALSGSLYTLVLTNGNEFWMSLQSNQTLSTITRVVGQ